MPGSWPCLDAEPRSGLTHSLALTHPRPHSGRTRRAMRRGLTHEGGAGGPRPPDSGGGGAARPRASASLARLVVRSGDFRVSLGAVGRLRLVVLNGRLARLPRSGPGPGMLPVSPILSLPLCLISHHDLSLSFLSLVSEALPPSSLPRSGTYSLPSESLGSLSRAPIESSRSPESPMASAVRHRQCFPGEPGEQW